MAPATGVKRRIYTSFAQYLADEGMPLVTRAVGYFPAQALGWGEDLPRGVALQWVRWCRRPEYMGDYTGHAALMAPILAYSFADGEATPCRHRRDARAGGTPG